MYDEVLESAYEEGYYRALADMGYEYDEYDDYDMYDAYEDVDMYDDDYFDDAMEGNPENKSAKNEYIRTHGGRNLNRPMAADPKMERRRGGYNADRDVELKTYGATRDSYESRSRRWDKMSRTVPVKDKRDLMYDHVDTVRGRGHGRNAESRAIHNSDFRSVPDERSRSGRVSFTNHSHTHW